MLVTPSNCRVIWSAVGETNLGCATLGIWQQHGSNLWGSHVGACLRRHLFGRIERLITVSLCWFGVPAWSVPPRSQCCCSLWRQLHAFRLQKLQHLRQPDCVYWCIGQALHRSLQHLELSTRGQRIVVPFLWPLGIFHSPYEAQRTFPSLLGGARGVHTSEWDQGMLWTSQFTSYIAGYFIGVCHSALQWAIGLGGGIMQFRLE